MTTTTATPIRTWTETAFGLFDKNGHLIETHPDGFDPSYLRRGDTVKPVQKTVSHIGFHWSYQMDRIPTLQSTPWAVIE